jgi:predicted RNA-binding Zn-ribbon protein involved in translation (DUF1610 family)
MYLKDDVIWFYGKEAGVVQDGIAYVRRKFQCGEMSCKLLEMNLKIQWIPDENLEHLYQIGDVVELSDGTVCSIDGISSGTLDRKELPWGEVSQCLFESERTALHPYLRFREWQISKLVRTKAKTKPYTCVSCGDNKVQLTTENKITCPECVEKSEQERLNMLRYQ